MLVGVIFQRQFRGLKGGRLLCKIRKSRQACVPLRKLISFASNLSRRAAISWVSIASWGVVLGRPQVDKLQGALAAPQPVQQYCPASAVELADSTVVPLVRTRPGSIPMNRFVLHSSVAMTQNGQ